MKVLKKIFALFIILSIMTSLIVITAGCDETKTEKKAMILIHGILGGAMYDVDSGEAVWAMDMVSTSEIMAMVSNLSTLTEMLSLDENGESVHNLRVANMNDERGSYTMLSMFEPLYTSLEEAYGDEYDVIVWQYDWRKDNIQSAVELQSFINDNGYDKVMFFTHSMGGNVVSQYLTMSEDNRNKVELFVPFSTPFLGSSDAYYFLLDGLFANVAGLMNSIPTANGRVDWSETFKTFEGYLSVAKPMMKELGENLTSIYMLSPFDSMWNDPVFAEGETPIMFSGTYQNHTDTDNYFKSLDGAKKTNGDYKPAYELYAAYQAGHMVMVDGKLTHIANTVNTHFIVGRGVDTIKTININSETNSIINFTSSIYGDGVVSMYSGAAGNSYDAANVHIMDGSSHISIITDDPAVECAVGLVAAYLGH
jgi:pimeloyl-ACP methyl ester carboxylesterase